MKKILSVTSLICIGLLASASAFATDCNKFATEGADLPSAQIGYVHSKVFYQPDGRCQSWKCALTDKDVALWQLTDVECRQTTQSSCGSNDPSNNAQAVTFGNQAFSRAFVAIPAAPQSYIEALIVASQAFNAYCFQERTLFLDNADLNAPDSFQVFD